MIGRIKHELKEHAPFTLMGALGGIIFMMAFRGISHEAAHTLFYIFHPLHICLSAIVTTGLFRRYLSGEKPGVKMFLKVLAVGYVGSVVVGTLSDSIMPFWGEKLMGMSHSHAHIGFIDKWWLINPLAIICVIISYNKPMTKFPHAGHVLISTWASLFHMLMACGHDHAVPYFGVFIFLFLAVWLPCCFSDIIFPLLFIKDKNLQVTCGQCGE